MSKNNKSIDKCILKNAELSRIRYFNRILEEAENVSVPAGERFNFLCIYEKNLDEFFGLKFIKLKDQSKKEVTKLIKKLCARKRQAFFSVISALNEKEIRLLTQKELLKTNTPEAEKYYLSSVKPKLNVSKNFPALLKDKITFSFLLTQNGEIIYEKEAISPYIDGKIRIAPYELIKAYGQYGKLLGVKISLDVKTNGVTRIVTDLPLKPNEKKMLCSFFKAPQKSLFFDKSAFLNADIFTDLKGAQRKTLFYSKLVKKSPWHINGAGVIEEIIRRDRLLFFPYDSFNPLLLLLKEAAGSKVSEIKITVYRLCENSKIAKALIFAAKSGKHVDVLIELRARFDEKNNLLWAKRLKEAGCNVILRKEKEKCHAKLLILKLSDGGAVTYISTGNFNESTMEKYTDICFFTADKKISEDAQSVFDYACKTVKKPRLKFLFSSPFGLREEILKNINEQAKKGAEGRIIFKANALTDEKIIHSLVLAAQAGVKITLLIRSVCTLIPKIKGLTENITVKSIVGRFLEHSRIYVFGINESARVYISSSDIMKRSLDKRIELLCPIEDSILKRSLLSYIELMLLDNVKSSEMGKNAEYFKKKTDNIAVDSQKLLSE